ncbi:MAG: hypothetical protein M1338_05400, partial [Patescibacteria group bacterium]|nr:hypothetical protein [Patescibacteria group bacterium]
LGLAGFGLAYYVFKSIKLRAGIIFWSIFAYYGLLRIILDQWRFENTSFWSLHSGQLTGILMVVVAAIAIVVMILYDKTRKKDK